MKNRDKMQISKIRYEIGDISTDPTENMRFYGNIRNNFMQTSGQYRGNAKIHRKKNANYQNELKKKYVNRVLTSKDIKLGTKNFPTKENPGPGGFTSKFYQICK